MRERDAAEPQRADAQELAAIKAVAEGASAVPERQHRSLSPGWVLAEGRNHYRWESCGTSQIPNRELPQRLWLLFSPVVPAKARRNGRRISLQQTQLSTRVS